MAHAMHDANDDEGLGFGLVALPIMALGLLSNKRALFGISPKRPDERATMKRVITLVAVLCMISISAFGQDKEGHGRGFGGGHIPSHGPPPASVHAPPPAVHPLSRLPLSRLPECNSHPPPSIVDLRMELDIPKLRTFTRTINGSDMTPAVTTPLPSRSSMGTWTLHWRLRTRTCFPSEGREQGPFLV